MWKIIVRTRQLIGGIVLLVSFVTFLMSNQFSALKLAFNYWDPFSISHYRLSHLSTDEYEDAVELALLEDDVSEAQELVALAEEYGHQISPDLIEKTQETVFGSSVRNTSDFVYGMYTGSPTNLMSLMGVLASDFFIIGDIRDIYNEGSLAVLGEEYDQFTLGFAVFGLTTSALAVTKPLQPGASVLKTANKIGKISKPLRKQLLNASKQLIDIDVIKGGVSEFPMPKLKLPSMKVVQESTNKISWQKISGGDFSDFKSIAGELIPLDTTTVRNTFSGAIRKDAVDSISLVAKSTSGIVTNGGIKSAMLAMEYADNAKELSRFNSLAMRMKDKTASIIKILGKNAIKLGKLAYWLVALALTAFGWLIGLFWLLFSILRNIRKIYNLKRI